MVSPVASVKMTSADTFWALHFFALCETVVTFGRKDLRSYWGVWCLGSDRVSL